MGWWVGHDSGSARAAVALATAPILLAACVPFTDLSEFSNRDARVDMMGELNLGRDPIQIARYANDMMVALTGPKPTLPPAEATVIDVAPASNLRQLSEYPLSGFYGPAFWLTSRAAFLFATVGLAADVTSENPAEGIDLSDPADPQPLPTKPGSMPGVDRGQFRTVVAGDRRQIYLVEPGDETAYVNWYGFRDIVTTPQIMGWHPIALFAAPDIVMATAPAESSPYLYVQADQQLYVYRAMAVGILTSVATEVIDLASLGEWDSGQSFLRVCSPWLLAGSGRGELLLIDISNPREPRLTATIVDLWMARDAVVVEDRFLVVADGLSGLVLYDISDPTRPVRTHAQVEGDFRQVFSPWCRSASDDTTGATEPVVYSYNGSRVLSYRVFE